MSTNYHVYIGFMVKVDLSKKIKIPVDTIGCPICKTEANDPYCGKCGGKNMLYGKERETVVDVNEILEEANLLDDYYSPSYDSESCPEYAYILCNQEVEYAKVFDDDEDGFYDLPRMAYDKEVSALIDVLNRSGLSYTQLEGIYTYFA